MPTLQNRLDRPKDTLQDACERQMSAKDEGADEEQQVSPLQNQFFLIVVGLYSKSILVLVHNWSRCQPSAIDPCPRCMTGADVN